MGRLIEALRIMKRVDKLAAFRPRYDGGCV